MDRLFVFVFGAEVAVEVAGGSTTPKAPCPPSNPVNSTSDL